MASAQIAIIPNTKCELCEENEITFKCFNCKQYLCINCKIVHLRSRASQDHRITTVQGADQQDCPSQGDQADSKTCNIHLEENANLFCENCDLQLCNECIVSQTHREHTISKSSDLIHKKRAELAIILEEFKLKLSQSQDQMKSINSQRKEFSDKTTERMTEVESRRTEIGVKLDQVTENVKSKLEKLAEWNEEKMKNREKQLKDDISELNEFISKCELQEIRTDSGRELNIFIKEVKQNLQNFNPGENPLKLLAIPTFVSHDSSFQEVKKLFGDLNVEKPPKIKKPPSLKSAKPGSVLTKAKIDVRMISTFKMEKPSKIALINDTTAWVILSGQRGITKVTTEGFTVQTVPADFNIFDVAVNEAGKVFVTMTTGGVVCELTAGGSFTNIYRDQEYSARGITVTDDKEIVVGLCKSDPKQGKLIQLTPSGQYISSTTYDKDGKTPLFENPNSISSNRNGDLIISDSGKRVTVLTNDRKLKFTYNGHYGKLRTPFNPSYTATDAYSQIIISDFSNSAIHLLDVDGNLVKYLLTSENGIQRPTGLAIDSSCRLLVCCEFTNEIKIIQYLKNMILFKSKKSKLGDK